MVKQQQTILLVEDEAIIAMLEAKQLERRGYHVVHALSGERAIEIVNEDLDSVDLILMDINLGSGMDGTEAAAIILKEHDIPVVFLSSHTEEEIVEKTENISSYGYVAKNSGETVLVASIKMAFKLHQARTTLIEKDRALQQKTEELDAFFAYARDLLCITDTEGNFIHLSKEWENVIGYPLEELEGENCLRFLHADDVKPTIEKLSQLSKQLPVIGYVNRYRRKDGSYRWIEWNSFPSGKRVYAAARDITERKFMEKRMLAWQNLMQYVIQYAPTAIAVHDKNLNYIFVSDRYLVEYGIKDRDIIGKHHYEVFPDLPEKWRAVHQRVLRGAIEHAENDPYIRSDGSVEITNWECRPWYDEEGEIGGLIVYTAVVTRQKNVEESLLLNNKRLQSIVDTLQYPARNMQDFLDHALEEAIQITASTIGYIYFYDDEKRLFALNTWSDDVMKECSITNPQTLYELDKTGIWGEAVRQRKPIVLNDFQADHPLKRGYPEGHVKLHRFLTIPVMIGERIVAVVGVANKQTDYDDTDVLQLTVLMDTIWESVERQRTADALQESEERYRLLTENVEDLIYRYELYPSRRFSYVSPSSVRITGYTPEEHYADPELGFKIVHPDDRSLLQGLETTMQSSKTLTLRWIKKDGEVIWTEQRNVPIFDTSGRLIAIEGIARDITDRKKMEDSLIEEHNRLSFIIKGSNVGTWDWNLKTGELIIDERWAGIVGYTLDELRPISIDTWNNLLHPDDVKRYNEALERHYSGETDYYECEVRIKHKDGHWIWILDQGKVLRWSSDGKPERFFGTHTDITALKQVEFELKSALDEKQTLFRELQHRVKNSMAMITSLIRLEADRHESAEVVSALHDIGGRVSVLADLYGLLYEQQGLTIELDSYLGRICESLSSSFALSDVVKLSTRMDRIEFDTKKASSVGLIVNELITNAYKYAFPSGRTGRILLELSQNEGSIDLTISDDGIGLPSGYDPETSDGFGFKLVRMLTDQLSGTFSWSSSGGTTFHISIPYSD